MTRILSVLSTAAIAGVTLGQVAMIDNATAGANPQGQSPVASLRSTLGGVAPNGDQVNNAGGAAGFSLKDVWVLSIIA